MSKDQLLDFLGTLTPLPTDMIKELQRNPRMTIEKWRRRTVEDWLRRRPHDGRDIFNFMQPQLDIPSLLHSALPPLLRWRFPEEDRETEPDAVYNMKVFILTGTFGVLDKYTRDKLNQKTLSLLWAEAHMTEKLTNCFGKADIQGFIRNTMLDCLNLADFGEGVQVYYDIFHSFSRIFSTKAQRNDIITLVKDGTSIATVCDIKLPGSDIYSVNSIVDYMIDLRYSRNVRFVFGIVTTYERWVILWLADANEAAKETSFEAFNELCNANAETAADSFVVSDEVNVYRSRVYDYSELALIETLTSLLYKVSMTPIYTGQKFIEPCKKYLLATPRALSYEVFPSSLNSFSYQMPSEDCSDFYLLKYHHRGGDGHTVLCCSRDGNLSVLKFSLSKEGEYDNLRHEADLWNQVWGTECRVVRIDTLHALLMPFCFHIKQFDGKPRFCELSYWIKNSSGNIDSHLIDEEVRDFETLNMKQLVAYQNDPRKAADEAISKMLKHNIYHEDMKWSHVALLPSFLASSDSFELAPILLDLTRTKPALDPSNEKLELLKQLDDN